MPIPQNLLFWIYHTNDMVQTQSLGLQNVTQKQTIDINCDQNIYYNHFLQAFTTRYNGLSTTAILIRDVTRGRGSGGAKLANELPEQQLHRTPWPEARYTR